MALIQTLFGGRSLVLLALLAGALLAFGGVAEAGCRSGGKLFGRLKERRAARHATHDVAAQAQPQQQSCSACHAHAQEATVPAFHPTGWAALPVRQKAQDCPGGVCPAPAATSPPPKATLLPTIRVIE
jgi:hypothetical protein